MNWIVVKNIFVSICYHAGTCVMKSIYFCKLLSLFYPTPKLFLGENNCIFAEIKEK